MLRCLAAWMALFLGCFMGMSTALAQDHIVERSWAEDPAGQWSWSDARKQTTQPFEGTLNRGYGTGVLWLRLRIDPQAGEVMGGTDADLQDLVLRIRPAYLDDVQLFDPLAPDGHAGTVGDRHHPRLDPLPGSDFLWPISRGDAPRDIWLRLQSTSTRQIHVAVLPPRELALRVLQWNIVTSLYIGAVMVLLLWACLGFVLRRDVLMGWFALMNITACLFGLTSLGFMRGFWPIAWSAEALNLLGSFASVLVVGAGVAFHARFLREFRPAPWAMGLLDALLLLVLVNLVLVAWGNVSWALQSNMVTILLAPPICLLCAITGRVWADSPEGSKVPALTRKVLVTFYLGFLTIFALSSTTGLGWLPATEWTIYVSQVHTLVISLLLMLVLQYRAFKLDQQRQQTQLALKTTTLAVAHERQLREEQEKLLAMLAHEIKTPLATMHLRLDGQAKGVKEIRDAMRDMNSVIDRCLQALQLGDGRLSARFQTVDLVDVVRSAWSASAQPANVQLNVPKALPVETDPQLLFIVLSNLLDNAGKYAKPQTTIELACALEHDRQMPQASQTPQAVRVTVANVPGKAGWPDPTHVFDKYYRSPQAKRQSGTGLGLYLAQHLVQALGGQLSYVPDDEVVRFVVTLPLNRVA